MYHKHIGGPALAPAKTDRLFNMTKSYFKALE